MTLAWAIAILVADQWSKRAIRGREANRLSWGSLVQFHCVPHRDHLFERSAFRIALLFTWLLALASAAILYNAGAWFHSSTSLAGAGLAFGGAASNLLDILQRRLVINIIDLGWWPVFNIADAAILAGLAAVFFG